jgi:hypothetical protein
MTIEQEGIQIPADDPMVVGCIRDVTEQRSIRRLHELNTHVMRGVLAQGFTLKVPLSGGPLWAFERSGALVETDS